MFPCGQRRGMFENTSSGATLSSSTSARIHMFHIDERRRPPLVRALSSKTASPSSSQCGCTWFGASVLPITLFTRAGMPWT